MRRLVYFIGRIFFLNKNKDMPKNPKKILVIRSGAIGDVLMTTPLVRAIRKKFTRAKITYLVGRWSKDVLEGNKNIDNLIVFDDDIIFKRKINKILELKNKIKKEKFDLCLILDKSYVWNLFAYSCKIPFRIGFDRKGEGFSNNLNVYFDGKKNEVEYYLDIARLSGASIKDSYLELPIPKKDEKFASDFIKKNKLQNKKIIGISPGGAENPGQKMHIKRWPKEKYKELVKKLANRYYIIIFGGKNDKDVSDYILGSISKNRERVFDLTGKATIKESAAVIKKCRLFITHDSGLMHVAAAMKAPLIALFGATDANRFAPKDNIVVKSSLSCSPCYDIYGRLKKSCRKECMDISAGEVLGKIKSMKLAE